MYEFAHMDKNHKLILVWICEYQNDDIDVRSYHPMRATFRVFISFMLLINLISKRNVSAVIIRAQNVETNNHH